jgi:hypothetical protein
MNSPTHEAVTQRAQQIWQNYGRPSGRDTEIWLEAERQLTAENGAERTFSSPIPGERGVKASLQKKEARAPKVPAKTAPKPTPPESGKPLWDRPHSS